MNNKLKQGSVIRNTGNGKGKSTSAVSMVLRPWGRGFRICVVQFIKAKTSKWGEIKAAKRLGIDWFAKGNGFAWTLKDINETVSHTVGGWEVAKEKITKQNGSYATARISFALWSK